MMGFLFTAFLDLLDERFGMEVTERVLEGCRLASRGVYASAGDYDPAELVALSRELNRLTGVDPDGILEDLGRSLFARLPGSHPWAFGEADTCFEFLEQLEERVHFEVAKLHEDRRPPSLRATRLDERSMELVYQTALPFEGLARGLLLGCAEHFGQPVELREDPRSASGELRLLVTLADPA